MMKVKDVYSFYQAWWGFKDLGKISRVSNEICQNLCSPERKKFIKAINTMNNENWYQKSTLKIPRKSLNKSLNTLDL